MKNMESKIIESLLEKYFEGQSTVEEENRLKQYFTGGEVAPQLKVYQPLFEFFESEKTVGLGEDFEQKLLEKIQPVKKEAIIRKMNFTWLRAAAIIVFVVAGLWMLRQWQPETTEQTVGIDWSKYEPEDPEKAYDQMMKALALVSEKMTEGEDEARKGLSKINEANEQITN